MGFHTVAESAQVEEEAIVSVVPVLSMEYAELGEQQPGPVVSHHTTIHRERSCQTKGSEKGRRYSDTLQGSTQLRRCQNQTNSIQKHCSVGLPALFGGGPLHDYGRRH